MFVLHASAQEAGPLEVKVQAELRVAEQEGKVVKYRYVPAAHFVQGQELYYTVRVRNTGGNPLRDAVVVQPIPSHTHYLAHSATGAGADITFSVDGGKTFAAAEELRAPSSAFEATEQAKGAASNLRAKPADYTHIRWQLRHPLEPGAVVLVRFRVVFD